METINYYLELLEKTYPNNQEQLITKLHAWLITQKSNGKGENFVTVEQYKNLIKKYL